MLANVGIKIYIALKSAVSAVLKEFLKTLDKKTYRAKRSFKRGDSTSLPCCSDFTPSLYIFSRVKILIDRKTNNMQYMIIREEVIIWIK